jgi:cytoskeletal protein CcmA (bactofilin family)
MGVGTNSPSEKLDVVGNIKASADMIAVNFRGNSGYFKSLESDGNLTVNGNIGIGVAPGAERLTVGGNAYVNGLLTTETLIVKQKLDLKGTLSLAGPLGVGIADPQAMLHVNGDGIFEGNLKANKITVNEIEIAGATSPDDTPTSVSFGDNLFVNGSMGIGTTKIEGYRLSVDGKIRAGDDIKVYSSTEWSDFVFEKDYKLKSLNEVEQYIKKHGHLSEIPSAREVSSNGVELVKMDAKLLQKIEELTLYMIEMKKENANLMKEITELKSSRRK